MAFFMTTLDMLLLVSVFLPFCWWHHSSTGELHFLYSLVVSSLPSDTLKYIAGVWRSSFLPRSRKASANVEQKEEAGLSSCVFAVWNGRVCLPWQSCTLSPACHQPVSSQQEASGHLSACEWKLFLLHYVSQYLLSFVAWITYKKRQAYAT